MGKESEKLSIQIEPCNGSAEPTIAGLNNISKEDFEKIKEGIYVSVNIP